MRPHEFVGAALILGGACLIAAPRLVWRGLVWMLNDEEA